MGNVRISTALWTLLLIPLTTVAQETAEAGADAGTGGGAQLDSFRDMIQAGGLPMGILFFLSILTVFMAVYLVLSLRSAVVAPRDFLRDAENAAAEGDVEALQAVCQDGDSAASRILLSATQHMVRGLQSDYRLIRDAVEDQGGREAGLMWQRVQYLMDIAAVAPMVGLLGTVIGMLRSFSGLQVEVGGVNPLTLTRGISQALVTTAGGLLVGIAATFLYALFRGRANRMISVLESSCNGVLRHFLQAQSSKG